MMCAPIANESAEPSNKVRIGQAKWNATLQM